MLEFSLIFSRLSIIYFNIDDILLPALAFVLLMVAKSAVLGVTHAITRTEVVVAVRVVAVPLVSTVA